MKKFLMLLMLMMSITISSFAQVQYYKSTSFAYATINQYSGRYTWSDWESSDLTICINLNTDVVTVYSPSIQVYRVYGTYNNGNAYIDNSGGRNVKFYVIDQDGDKGEIRLRIERNGNSQIYIDFKDVAWVYNVRRTS